MLGIVIFSTIVTIIIIYYLIQNYFPNEWDPQISCLEKLFYLNLL